MKEDIFSIIAKLSSTDVREENELEHQCGRLMEAVEARLAPAIDSSRYPHKNALKSAIDAIVDDALLLSRYPQLIGRTVVGLLFGSSARSRKILSELVAGKRRPTIAYKFFDSAAKQWAKRQQLPAILDKDEATQVELCDDIGRRIQMTDEEYADVMAAVSNGIDLRCVASNSIYTAPLLAEKAAFILLPSAAYNDAEIYIGLASLCDAFIAIDDEGARAACDLPKSAAASCAPIYVLRSRFLLDAARAKKRAKMIAKEMHGCDVHVLDIDNIDKLIGKGGQLDTYCDNMLFVDRLRAEMLVFSEDVEKKLAVQTKIAESLARDHVLMNIDDEKTAEAFANSRSNAVETIDELSAIRRAFDAAANGDGGVLKRAEELEELMRAPLAEKGWSPSRLHAGPMRSSSLWRRIALRNVAIDDIRTAKTYADRLRRYDENAAFIVDLYIDEATGRKISQERFDHLRTLPINSDVKRAVIHFRARLGASEIECAEMAFGLGEDKTVDELYFSALSHGWDNKTIKNRTMRALRQEEPQKKINALLKDDGVRGAMRTAALAGSKNAISLLAFFYSKYSKSGDDFDALCTMADLGSPLAARLASDSERKGDGLVGSESKKTYQRMAAALGDESAVYEIARETYKRIGKKTFKYSEGRYVEYNKEAAEKALALFRWIDEHGLADEQMSAFVKILFADLLFTVGKWSEVRAVLQSIEGFDHTCYFLLAVLDWYGHAGPVNREKAYKLMDRAISTRSNETFDETVRFYVNIRDAWHKIESEEEAAAARRLKESQDNTVYRGSSTHTTSGGFCFITSATCRAEGRPDDCAELTAIRRYRDEVLAKTDDGRALIDTYYRIAPTIVKRIDASDDREAIYDSIFENYIDPIYHLLLDDRGDDAKEMYITMVKKLAERYDVAI